MTPGPIIITGPIIMEPPLAPIGIIEGSLLEPLIVWAKAGVTAVVSITTIRATTVNNTRMRFFTRYPLS
jgi:hypothetical protein